MPDASSTIGELYKAKIVTEEKLVAAVDAYMADPTIDFFKIADGYVVDPAAAVKAHEPSRKAVADPDKTGAFKRGIVRSAIVLARAVKA